ncbi:MAG TPA: hypothetical protein VNR89_04150 [Roseomonas sp.]|nr:hypothetical protein [Roseomonas sp.]
MSHDVVSAAIRHAEEVTHKDGEGFSLILTLTSGRVLDVAVWQPRGDLIMGELLGERVNGMWVYDRCRTPIYIAKQHVIAAQIEEG